MGDQAYHDAETLVKSKKDLKVAKTIITSPFTYKPIGPYSQAVLADNNTLYVSGILGMDSNGQLVCGGTEEQTRQVLENMKHVLEAGNASLDAVVKTTILLADINDFRAVNQVYSEYFANMPPVRATYQVGHLPLGAAVEIEVLALAGQLVVSDAVSVKELKLSEEAAEIVEDENPVIVEKGNESNGIPVLPTCDNLGETTHLDINKSLVDTTNPDLAKGSEENGLITKSENESRSTSENTTDAINRDIVESTQTEEKLSTLEEVVEKVVELYVESPLESKPVEQHSKGTNNNKKHKGEETKEKQQDGTDTKDGHEEEFGLLGEVTSPSQSQSSRATRWEALADIAAELPPSLAVDPLTGQIFSFSK